ncbi:amidohydrolase [Vineibacter terrae]|uniref:Amidohydrolase n=1 Tax=Vineibacter terrae TaxID=2586908 RepID=A0A5C8PRG1_9HYPH|nr:amidohydrolase family protein [Vineibacter terrae]TXL78113.1 amidohydrolase [Vineibacter terrae]
MAYEPVLPIKLDSTSNGEFAPVPVSPGIARANRLAAQRITDNARHTGQKRRTFLTGLCGAATTLLTLNEAFASQGARGGAFELPPEAGLDPQMAQAITGREFIFDIQTHMIEAQGTAWRNGPSAGGLDQLRSLLSLPPKQCAEGPGLWCYDARNFVKDVFLDSDTDLAVLSFVPALPDENPVSMKEATRVRDLVAGLGDGRRLLLHAMVVPNAQPYRRQLERMVEMHRAYGIAAWKVYPQWGPRGVGWWLDDPEVGIPFIEQARRIGVNNICMHKGLAFGGQEPRYASCVDVGRVAKRYPDVNFIIYHSGFEISRREGPYDPARADRGIDSLVKSLQDNGIAPNSNVYAELGSTWRMVMRDPDQAAHTLGKLLKHVGDKRVLWGSDSIWYGSPQDQIQAFRAFQISREFQDRYGYPALTPAIKADVFGLNAAPVYRIDPATARRRADVDTVGRLKAAYLEAPDPSFATYGPRDATEWRRFRARHGDGPG